MRRHFRRHFVRLLLVALVLAVISSCANIGYYAQSVSGQMSILNRARPIEELIADPATPEHLIDKLRFVANIRNYASSALGLPDNDSYRYYADMRRPYVLWNVFAAEEFSTKLKTWCFPIAGCVGYRGYFSKEDAEAYAADLRARGYDVAVKGIAAYSTLGWLRDPVLNTVLNRSEPDLAGLLFHELAHQVVYVSDDSTFNESFATAVELEGVHRWIEQMGSTEMHARYDAAVERRKEFVGLLSRYRERLKALYASPVPDAEKRAGKIAAFDAMRAEYATLKERWNAYTGYDAFFAHDLNNAALASVAAYTDLVPAFQQLLAQSKGDLPAFYREVRELSHLSKKERLVRLGVTHTIAQSP